MTEQRIRFISKGRIETLQACRRKYYLSYHVGGEGYEPVGPPNIDLWGGILSHKGMEILYGSKELARKRAAMYLRAQALPEDIAPDLMSQYDEARALAEAHVVAWDMVWREEFDSLYEVTHVEWDSAMIISPGVRLKTKADLVVRDKSSGGIYVINWKTTQDMRNWTRKWRYDIQSFTEALALEQEIGEPVLGTIFVGMNKGVRREGVLSSPLIYGWRKGNQISPSYKPGFTKFPIWKEMTPEAWIETLPRPLVRDQFILSQPLPKNNDVIEGWLNEVVGEETEVDYLLDDDSKGEDGDYAGYFPRNIGSQCAWCPFEPVCMERTNLDEMLAAKLLKRRESPLNEMNRRGGREGA